MSDSSALPKSCPQCGAALPVEATEGLCPRCLMAQALQPSLVADDVMAVTHPGSAPAGAGPRGGGPELPLPEELTVLLPPDTYAVEYLIGRGGMGAVYKGAQLRLQRPVAIKIMRRDQGRDHGFEQRFHREALAMAKLNHPNIVSVIDYGEAGPDYLYIVMELVDGADMMDVIRTGRMTQEMALTLLPQICDALQFAHDHGIVHRDIKPSNIILTRDGRIKMADFGLAKRYDVESSFQTQSGTGMGTPDYAAPEQFIADSPIDHRADIYALGVMIYQMLTGQLPRGVWKPPTQHTACDPQWDDIVSHAMQNDPKDRYQQASEIKTDVSSIPSPSAEKAVSQPPHSKTAEPHAKTGAEREASWSAVGSDSTTPLSSRPKSRAPLLFGILTGIIVLGVGAFVVMKRSEKSGPLSPLSGTSAVSTPEPAQGTERTTFAGHRYQFVPGALRWDEAKTKAEEMGGHLATVTSKEENEFIYATFGDKLDPAMRASSIWIGGFADDMGQPFKWVTGEPFVFTDWSAGEPDYSGTSGQPQPGTFGMVIKHHGKLGWFDDPVKRDNSKAGFIVEWDDDGTGKPAPLAPGSMDLLALADVVQDAVGGTWRREGTDLIVAEDAATAGGRGVRFGFALPVQVKGSYQLEVEFTKHGPRGTVCLFLPLTEGRSVVAHFQESGTFAGLVEVRGYTTREPENPTRVPNRLEDEHRYRGIVKVLLKGDQVDIAATLEGKPLFQFQGPVTDLESSRLLTMTDPARPGLKSIDPVTWHSVRITPLDGGTLTPVRPGVIPPPTTGTAGGTMPPAPAAVDLLALADVVKDAEGGVWKREGTDLTAAEDTAEVRGRGIRLSLALPVRVKGSYRLEVEFTKHGRKETVSVILPLADGRSVVANFLESANFAGLVSVRGLTTKDADNPTRTPHQLENERRYKAAVQVLLNGDQADITATFEGKPLFRFQGPVADLDSRQFAMADQMRPGIKSMDPVTWHNVRITPLDGGTLTPAREGVTLPATSP